MDFESAKYKLYRLYYNKEMIYRSHLPKRRYMAELGQLAEQLGSDCWTDSERRELRHLLLTALTHLYRSPLDRHLQHLNFLKESGVVEDNYFERIMVAPISYLCHLEHSMSDEEIRQIYRHPYKDGLCIVPSVYDHPATEDLRCLFEGNPGNCKQAYYYVIRPTDEDISEIRSFFEQRGYTIGDIFEIEGDREREKAILFLRKDDDRSISFHYRRHVKVDGNDKIVDECYEAKDGYYSLHTSPRFFSVVGERTSNCEDKTKLIAENSSRYDNFKIGGVDIHSWLKSEGDHYYYCINRASEPKTHMDVIGDKVMKHYFQKVDFKYASSFSPRIRFVEAPAIVVDLDRASAIVFNIPKADKEEGNQFPFLLDEHFVSFKLTKDKFENDREMLAEYKSACGELNKKLQAWFDTIAGKMSHVPGMPYHLSFAEKRYILTKCFNSMISTSKPYRSRAEKNEMVCLTPCGFDLRPYLQKLAAIDRDGRADKKRKRVELNLHKEFGTCVNPPEKKFLPSSLVLWSLMINDKIAEAYNKLTPEEKQRWDIWDKINHWSYPEPTHEEYEQERKNRSMTSSGSWRRKSELKLSFELIDERNSSIMNFSIKGERCLRSTYFATLLPLGDADKATQNVNTALKELKMDSSLEGDKKTVIERIIAAECNKATE